MSEAKVIQFDSGVRPNKQSEEERQDRWDLVAQFLLTAEFTRSGKVLSANPNFLGALGYEEAQIKLKSHDIFVGNRALTDSFGSQFWEELATGQSQQGDFPFATKSGDTVVLRGVYKPIRDESGNVVRITLLGTPVTDLSVKHELEKDLKDLPVPVVALDSSGRISRLNRIAEMELSALDRDSFFQDILGNTPELRASLSTEGFGEHKVSLNSEMVSMKFQRMTEGHGDRFLVTWFEKPKTVTPDELLVTDVERVTRALEGISEQGQRLIDGPSTTGVEDKARETIATLKQRVEGAWREVEGISLSTIQPTSSTLPRELEGLDYLATSLLVEAARFGDAGRPLAILAEKMQRTLEKGVIPSENASNRESILNRLDELKRSLQAIQQETSVDLSPQPDPEDVSLRREFASAVDEVILVLKRIRNFLGAMS